MTKLTFKQYTEALAAAETNGSIPDFITEGPIWDKIKATAKRNAAAKTELSPEELERLHALSVKGNLEARRDLTAYLRQKQKEGKVTGRLARVAKAHAAHDKDIEGKFQRTRAEIEAAERGSSRAFDRETGSMKKRDVRWDPDAKRWVHSWNSVGKNH